MRNIRPANREVLDILNQLRTMRKNQPEFAELARRVPPHLLHWLEYASFQTKLHVRRLGLSKTFLKTLGPTTRMLEIGAGSGRLTEHLIKNTRLTPENYEIMDISYEQNPPFLKKAIHLLKRRRRIKVTAGNMFEREYPQDYYHHILLPEAFHPRTLEDYGKLEEDIEPAGAELVALARLVNKLARALKYNGTIRISGIHLSLARRVIRRKVFPAFRIRRTSGGLILTKTRKADPSS